MKNYTIKERIIDRIEQEYNDYINNLLKLTPGEIINKYIYRTHVYQSILDFIDDDYNSLNEEYYIELDRINENEILDTIYDDYISSDYTSIETYNSIRELLEYVCECEEYKRRKNNE